MSEVASLDCILVGAGIVGAACALACVEAGLSIAVVERASVGGGATAAAMGHAVLMSDTPAQFALTLRSQQLWEAMRPRLPASAEYHTIGTLWIAADDREMAAVDRQHAFYSGAGVASRVLGPAVLAAAEPNLRRPLKGALHMPGDSVMLPQVAAAWMLEQAMLRGATLLEGEAVAAGKGELHLQDGRTLRARSIVLATGIDAATLAPELPLRSRKGHLMITQRYLGYVRHQVAEMGYLHSAHGDEEDSVACNIQPRANGQLLIGSSRQYGVEDASVDPQVLAAMLARAIEYLPGLGELAFERVWTGFRAATPDRLPIIGPRAGPRALPTASSRAESASAGAAGGDPSIFLATGHEGLGITTSLATAELLVDHLLGRAGAIPCEPYLPARFQEVALSAAPAHA